MPLMEKNYLYYFSMLQQKSPTIIQPFELIQTQINGRYQKNNSKLLIFID